MVLQLLAATEKTGELEVRGEDDSHRGFLGFDRGQLVSARVDDEDGYLALGAIFTILRGDFEFLPQAAVARRDLTGDLEDLLERAIVERDRIAEIRQAIPTDTMRFRLSARAAERAEITLGSQQWRTLLLVDGLRDVVAISRELQMPVLATQLLLAQLVRAGLIDAVAPEAADGARPYRRLPPMQPIGDEAVLRGGISDFPLETVVQLLAETKKTGRLEVRAGRDSSSLGMDDGRLVSAIAGEEEGELALGTAFTAQDGEFHFVPADDAPPANLTGTLDALLDRAAETRDRIATVRSVITNERSRFTLSDRATRNPEIVLTPEQWRVLLGVNGTRDVDGIAEHLRMRRLPVMLVLAELVRGGYVDLLPPAEPAWPAVERRRAPWPAPPPPPPMVVEERIAEEAPVVEVATPTAETEVPLEETPLDREREDEAPFAAIESVAGPAEPAPPPAAWEPPPPIEPTFTEAAAAEATAEAFAATPPEPEETAPTFDPRLAAFGPAPVVEPEPAREPEPAPPPTWETPAWEAPAPAWEQPAPAVEEPRIEEPAPEVDPRLAAFGAPTAQPETPTWEAPAAETPPWQPPSEPMATEEPRAAEPETAEPLIDWGAQAPEIEAPAAAPPSPAVAPEKKKGGLLGGLFGGGAKAAPAPAPTATPIAATRSGQLAAFANELVAAYNSGHYGKGRVEDRMISLLMRADEQADPIDRPLPVTNDRLDVSAIDAGAVADRQGVPYLAVVVRHIYDDAERALGKDKARKGYRDVRDRVFGKDLSLLQSAEVAARVPKV